MGILTFQAAAGGALNLNGPYIAGTVNLTLPSADGTSGQPLQTNGSGTLSFANLAIANGGTGTTSFTANQIHYGSFSQSAGLTFDGTNFATTGTATAAKLIPTGTSVTGNGMYLPATNTLGFSTAGAETMRIDSGGNFLVGGTTAKGKVNFQGSGEIVSLISTAATGSNYLDFYKGTGATSQGYIGYGSGSNDYISINNQLDRVQVIAVSAGVYLATGGTSWSVLSDERKKDIIEPISGAANKVSTLRAVIGKYKTDAEGTRRTFLIAQDVQAVLPEAVNVENPEDGTLGLQYTDVIPLLVAAIKEQQALITQLTDRIAALEAK